MIKLVTKRLFLLIAPPFLLATLAYSQTPAPSVPVSDTKSDKINLKGCVGGTDPDYTIAEDQTGGSSKSRLVAWTLKSISAMT